MSFSIFNVNPGDLITADFMNSVLQELSALDSSVVALSARVTALEQELVSPPSKQTKDTKEKEKEKEKEKDAKETKEIREKFVKEVEKAQFLEGGGKSVIKDVEKFKEVEKAVEKQVEKRFEKSVVELAGELSTRSSAATEPVAEHFISAELRPDLATSALRGEPDPPGGDSGGAS